MVGEVDSHVFHQDLVEGAEKAEEGIFSFGRPKLAFPNGDDIPSHLREFFVLFFVAADVAFDFLLPEICVGIRQTKERALGILVLQGKKVTVESMSMPKATIH